MLGRYLVELLRSDGHQFEIGVDKDETCIELMSGEVYRVDLEGQRRKVDFDKTKVILETVRDGLMVLSKKEITIP